MRQGTFHWVKTRTLTFPRCPCPLSGGQRLVRPAAGLQVLFNFNILFLLGLKRVSKSESYSLTHMYKTWSPTVFRSVLL